MTFDLERATAVAARIERADALQAQYRMLDPRRRWRTPSTWFRRARIERTIAALLAEPLP